jgi:trehalose synthase
MGNITQVDVRTRTVDRFGGIASPELLRELLQMAPSIRTRMEGRVNWHVNTTAVGGGVAEMLRQHVAYGRGGGIDVRWVVISGGPDFFRITKRLHHALHGAEGDGSPLGERERGVYEETLRQNAVELATRVRPRDIVLLHDPQTAGLAPHLLRSGALVLWRCHIGSDESNAETERGWHFLRPYLGEIPALIFTRKSYVPDFVEADRVAIIAPSIDAFSPKNWELDDGAIRTILVHTGLVEGPLPTDARYVFQRADGTPGRIERQADVFRLGRPPSWDTPLVAQISRWDPLKDPMGVMRGFARLNDGRKTARAELVLAGPNVSGVTDDPEGAEVFEQVVNAWRELPHAVRSRVHLAMLPTADVEENAVIVNALQRHATVIVQKSLKEGFGLTVTEGMWKGRPVVASGVGGIQDQIEDGKSGLLLQDPTDPEEFAAALRRLLDDPEFAEQLGAAARERAVELYLDTRHLVLLGNLIERIDV